MTTNDACLESKKTTLDTSNKTDNQVTVIVSRLFQDSIQSPQGNKELTLGRDSRATVYFFEINQLPK